MFGLFAEVLEPAAQGGEGSEDFVFTGLGIEGFLATASVVEKRSAGVGLEELAGRGKIGKELGQAVEELIVAGKEADGAGGGRSNLAPQAFENGERTGRGVAPCTGPITKFIPPGGPGIRIDTHVYQGATVSPYDDSMVAKLIVHQRNPDEAINTTKRALREFRIESIRTTIPIHIEVLSHDLFARGQVDTNFIEKDLN